MLAAVPERSPASPRSTSRGDTDRRIIGELQRDARQSNVAIARRIGLTEGAVRRRVENLVASGVLRFVAVADPEFLGQEAHALLRIRCAPHLVDEVIAALREVPELERVYHCTGQFDLTAVAHFASTAMLREFTVHRVGAIAGIVELQSELILQTVDPIPPTAAGDDKDLQGTATATAADSGDDRTRHPSSTGATP